MWVLGSEPRSSARATRALDCHCPAIPPATPPPLDFPLFCACAMVHMEVRDNCRSWFSPSTVWGLGIELWFSALVANVFAFWAILRCPRPSSPRLCLSVPCSLGHPQCCVGWASSTEAGHSALVLQWGWSMAKAASAWTGRRVARSYKCLAGCADIGVASTTHPRGVVTSDLHPLEVRHTLVGRG